METFPISKDGVGFLVGCRKSFDRFSFPRSSVGMPASRSSGPNYPNKIGMLERLDALPR